MNLLSGLPAAIERPASMIFRHLYCIEINHECGRFYAEFL